MDDIVERLRSWQCASTRLRADFDDAADEIERLRTELAGHMQDAAESDERITVLASKLDEARRLLSEAVIQGGHNADLNKRIDAFLAADKETE